MDTLPEPRTYHHDELEFLRRTMHLLREYQRTAVHILSWKQRSLALCSVQHKKLLLDVGLGLYFESCLNGIEINQVLLTNVKKFAIESLEMDDAPSDASRRVYDEDYLRLIETFSQIVREWTVQGAEEREQCFGLILKDIAEVFPESELRAKAKVVVPGCGLGRLVFEIAKKGFECFGIEQNLLTCVMGNFILSGIDRAANYRFYPWIHNMSNTYRWTQAAVPVSFPDVSPSRELDYRLDIIPGDFVTQLPDAFEAGTVDCVATSFLFASAINVVSQIDAIARSLKPGGYWINVGPLNNVSERFETEIFLELTWEMLRSFILKSGFHLVKEETNVRCSYRINPNSMVNLSYQCVHFIAKKEL